MGARLLNPANRCVYTVDGSLEVLEEPLAIEQQYPCYPSDSVEGNGTMKDPLEILSDERISGSADVGHGVDHWPIIL